MDAPSAQPLDAHSGQPLDSRCATNWVPKRALGTAKTHTTNRTLDTPKHLGNQSLNPNNPGNPRPPPPPKKKKRKKLFPKKRYSCSSWNVDKKKLDKTPKEEIGYFSGRVNQRCNEYRVAGKWQNIDWNESGSMAAHIEKRGRRTGRRWNRGRRDGEVTDTIWKSSLSKGCRVGRRLP